MSEPPLGPASVMLDSAISGWFPSLRSPLGWSCSSLCQNRPSGLASVMLDYVRLVQPELSSADLQDSVAGSCDASARCRPSFTLGRRRGLLVIGPVPFIRWHCGRHRLHCPGVAIGTSLNLSGLHALRIQNSRGSGRACIYAQNANGTSSSRPGRRAQA